MSRDMSLLSERIEFLLSAGPSLNGPLSLINCIVLIPRRHPERKTRSGRQNGQFFRHGARLPSSARVRTAPREQGKLWFFRLQLQIFHIRTARTDAEHAWEAYCHWVLRGALFQGNRGALHQGNHIQIASVAKSSDSANDVFTATYCGVSRLFEKQSCLQLYDDFVALLLEWVLSRHLHVTCIDSFPKLFPFDSLGNGSGRNDIPLTDFIMANASRRISDWYINCLWSFFNNFRSPDVETHETVRFIIVFGEEMVNVSCSRDSGKNVGRQFSSWHSSSMARVRWGELRGAISIRSLSSQTSISAAPARAD